MSDDRTGNSDVITAWLRRVFNRFKANRDSRQRLIDKGMTFAQASPEDMQVMLDVAPNVWEIWLQKAGPEAKGLVDEIKSIVAEWEKKGRKL